MPYIIPDFAAIRQRMLRDAANLDSTAPQDRDSDLYVRSSATASAVSGLYDFLAWQARQLLPDTAAPNTWNSTAPCAASPASPPHGPRARSP